VTPHILVVDDDRQIRISLSRFLTAGGLRVSNASNAFDMFEAIEANRIDLIVLDIMMPREDGLSAFRRLREGKKMPVVFLTAVSTETDRIIGLELGADDYLSKPFNPRELLARIRAVLRRCSEGSGTRQDTGGAVFEFQGWVLDAVRRTLRNPDGALVDLTAGEYDLLVAFAERPQHVLSRDQLLDLTRGRTSGPFDRTIDVQVSRLRRKIETDPGDPQLIKTVRSGGYIFCCDVTSGEPKAYP
jgi:two-component system OmpR family response regulator